MAHGSQENIEVSSRTGIQPYFRIFEVATSPNVFARKQGITKHKDLTWETGISAYTGFGKGFTVSGILDYTSSRPQFQRIEFSDVLYFISIGKSIGENSKIEISSGLPFKKSFTYRGHKIDAAGFSSRSEGILKLSAMPLMMKFTFRFSRGKKRDRIQHEDAITPERSGTGF